MEKISKDVVRKVAKIARLNLTEKEAEKYSRDLQSILEAFRDMDRVDTEGVKPSFQPLEVSNVYRKDVPEKSLTQEEALANTKHKENGYFKGPKTI